MSLKTDDVLPPGYRLHWYQLQSLLGDGGFGITYLGRDTNLNQSVAIKEYYPKSLVHRGDAQQVVLGEGMNEEIFEWGLQRFLEEARLLARFRHPNIVRVLSVFEELGTAFIVMELERGQSVSEAVQSESLTTEEQLTDLIMPLLDGLDLVHKSGFIHRDIKPRNILLRGTAGPVLIDFGSARQPLPGQSSELTAIVSRGYAPFEQYDAGTGQRQGPWTDIYGLAATVYHVITGGPPADALTRGMCLLNGDPDPYVPATVCAAARYSNTLLKAVDRGLAFKSDDRPQSVAEWRQLFPEHSRRQFQEHMDVRTVALDPNDETAAVRERLQRSEDAADEPGGAPSVAEDSGEATQLNPVVEAPPQLDRSILIVDDEPAARILTQRVLANLGATRIDTAAGGEEALALLADADELPDIVICDLEMPDMDGVQLLRQIAERGLTASVLIVGDADERLLGAVSRLAEDQGLAVVGALRKPLRPDALARLLATVALSPGSSGDGPQAESHPLDDDVLRAGVDAGAMDLVYLPKVSLADRELLGVEALVRWPEAAVDIGKLVLQVEDLGLADAFTEQVLRKALAEAGRWKASGIHCGVSVNMFAGSLGFLGLPEHLVRVAAEEGITARDITLEVNEMRFNARGSTPLEVLARLRLHGVELAIDDFGTGSSTLEQLRRVPFTEVKVDRSFVAAAVEDRTSRVILESSVSLARRLGMRAVAEGVEDERTWELVSRLGFNAAQGYYISPPIQGAALGDWSRDWSMGRQTRAPGEHAASA